MQCCLELHICRPFTILKANLSEMSIYKFQNIHFRARPELPVVITWDIKNKWYVP